MSGFKIDWKGMNKALTALANAPDRLNYLTDAVVKNNTELVKAKAKEKAPVDTSFLKDHITTSYPEKNVGQINDDASYAGYQEYGTRFQTGTPHLGPAVKEIIPKMREDLNDVMKGVFK